MSVGVASHFEMKLNKASALKDEGNLLFKQQKLENARTKYQQALVILQPNSFYGATEVQCQKLAYLSASLLFNVGTCCFMMQKWKDAELIYSEALTINPQYVKAIFKRGMARYELQDYERAMEDVLKAHQLDKGNNDIREGYEKVRLKYNQYLKESKAKQKEMNSKIFSPKKQGKSDVQKKEEEGSNWWMWTLIPLAAVAAYQGLKYLKN